MGLFLDALISYIENVEKKLPSKLIFIGFFLGLGLWYARRFPEAELYLTWQAWLPLLSWFLGGFIGYWLLSLDRLVDIYFTHPETQLSHYVRYYIKKGQYKWALATLQKRKREQERLTFRSALFHLVWVVLAFFALTSTTSLLGKGVVIGIGLHLLLDEWEDYLVDQECLRRWLFWQIKREVSLKEQKIFLWGMTFLTLVLGMMAL